MTAAAALGQTPAVAPAFEVASIKPASPPDPAKVMAGQFRVGMSVDGARVDLRFMSLGDLIRTAYKIKPHQLSAPDWIGGERWDIQAKLPEGATKEQVPEMLQALLADRFKVRVHHDSKEVPVYALVVAKGGPKLKESPPDAAPVEGAPPTPSNQVSVNQDKKGVVVRTGQSGATRMSMGPGGTMHMESEKVTMGAFADMLSGFVDRPVVDMTELKGNYQVALDLSMDDLRNAARKAGVAMPPMGAPGGAASSSAAAPQASDPSGPAIFGAIQQMGLKLEARKGPVETIVVDHAEKTPTEN
jgi:uncharacterized protein (TIGR03435 family)